MSPLLTSALVAFCIAFLLVWVLTTVIMRICLRVGHVARPDPWHDQPVALSAGTGVWLGFTVIALTFAPLDSWVLAVIGGSAAMFLVGLLDDLRPFRADVKLALQLLVAAVVTSSGVQVGLISLPVVAIPLTIFWMVGLTNAVNLIDNMDGLAPGVAGIAAVFLGVLALGRGDVPVAILSFSLAGACAGFLPFNMAPARAFLGDAGALFLGFCLASVGILSTWQEASSLFLTLGLPVLVLWVPIFNTTFVTVTRFLLRVPISKGQADHINYRLVAHGLSARHSVWLVYGLAVLGGLFGVFYSQMSSDMAVATALLAVVVVGVLGLFLFEGDVSSLYKQFNIESDDRLARLARRYRAVVMVIADLLLVTVSYYGAYLIRFEGDLSQIQHDNFIDTLPMFVVVRVLVLALFGMHQRHWRYVSVVDLVALAQAIGLGSLIHAGIVFGFQLPAFSRSVLLLDALLAFLLLGGMRVSTRVLRNYVYRFTTKSPGEPVLLVGGGDAGELAIRELTRRPVHGMRPVGILDDDPAKKGARIHGISVVGSIDSLADAAKRCEVGAVVLAIPSASAELRVQVFRAAHELGLGCYEFWVSSLIRRVGVEKDADGGVQITPLESRMISDAALHAVDDSEPASPVVAGLDDR